MKMWEAKGYAGFHDYDSKEDYNFRHVWCMDDDITKADVAAVVEARHKGKRVLVYEVCELTDKPS